MITRVLGTDPDVDVDTFSVEAQAGDIFMICSDGLTSMVDDEAILGLVERDRDDLDKAARALVDAANKGGGEDNITVVLFEIGEASSDARRTRRRCRRRGAARRTTRGPLTELDGVPVVDGDTMLSRDEIDGGLRPAAGADTRRASRARRSSARRRSCVVLARSSSGASLARTSSAPSRTATSPSTRASRGTSSAACSSTASVREPRARRPALAGRAAKLFDHDLRGVRPGARRRWSSSYEAEIVPVRNAVTAGTASSSTWSRSG